MPAAVVAERAEVAVRGAIDSPSASASMIAEIRGALATVDEMTAEQAQKALIWAEAVVAAANMRRAWDIAREACEMKIRTERRLGVLLGRLGETLQRRLDGDHIPSDEDRVSLNPRIEGAYIVLGKIPGDLFDSVVSDLLGRRKSVDVYTVLRAAHRQSLEKVEAGIYVAWDGTYFLNGEGQPRRASSNDLERVRAELREMVGVKKDARPIQVVALDEAFSKARRDAQALEKLKGKFFGEVYTAIEDAELMQAKVAEMLFEAYRVATATQGSQRTIR